MKILLVIFCLIVAIQSDSICSCSDSTGYYTYTCYCGCPSYATVSYCSVSNVCYSCGGLYWWGILLIILGCIFLIGGIVLIVRWCRARSQYNRGQNNVQLMVNSPVIRWLSLQWFLLINYLYLSNYFKRKKRSFLINLANTEMRTITQFR